MSASLYYDDARAAIDWLVRAFGFRVRLRVDGDGGGVMHSELTFGDAVIMVASAGRNGGVSPRNAGGVTGGLFLYVDDADAHEAHARAAGATITREIDNSDYGPESYVDRIYGCTDPEGHQWFFAHRVHEAPAK
jgi:uncharacterized glyoxalase superfamily protein PhnB